MTKKDYDMIAACIGGSYKYGGHKFIAQSSNEWDNALYDVTMRIVNELSLDNPRFDRRKFMDRIQYWTDQK